MNITEKTVVKSIAGHDKNKLYCVISLNKDFALLVNGKTKKMRNPKRKKLKHLETVQAQTVSNEVFQSDKRIRRLLREIAEQSV